MNDISEVFYPRDPQDPLHDRLAQVEAALHELSKNAGDPEAAQGPQGGALARLELPAQAGVFAPLPARWEVAPIPTREEGAHAEGPDRGAVPAPPPAREVISRPAGACAAIAAFALALGGAAAAAGQGLAPITLTEAGADGQRRPFARWTPAYPIVNVLVSTRPIRAADGRPAQRYWVEADSYGIVDDGPEPAWRGDDPLVPGTYWTAIQGDAPGQGGMPWTPFKRFRVIARRGEWAGPTSQRRYIRFARTPRGALRGLAFSVFARGPGCTAHSSFALPRSVAVREDGSFSAGFRGVSNLPGTSSANVRITGRVGRRVATGVVRVRNLFEGCRSGRVRWSARPSAQGGSGR